MAADRPCKARADPGREPGRQAHQETVAADDFHSFSSYLTSPMKEQRHGSRPGMGPNGRADLVDQKIRAPEALLLPAALT